MSWKIKKLTKIPLSHERIHYLERRPGHLSWPFGVNRRYCLERILFKKRSPCSSRDLGFKAKDIPARSSKRRGTGGRRRRRAGRGQNPLLWGCIGCSRWEHYGSKKSWIRPGSEIISGGIRGWRGDRWRGRRRRGEIEQSEVGADPAGDEAVTIDSSRIRRDRLDARRSGQMGRWSRGARWGVWLRPRVFHRRRWGRGRSHGSLERSLFFVCLFLLLYQVEGVECKVQ